MQGDQGNNMRIAGVTPASVVQQPEMFEEKAAKRADAAETNCQEAADKEMIYRGLVAKSASRAEETVQGDQGKKTGTAGVNPAMVIQQPEIFKRRRPSRLTRPRQIVGLLKRN